MRGPENEIYSFIIAPIANGRQTGSPAEIVYSAALRGGVTIATKGLSCVSPETRRLNMRFRNCFIGALALASCLSAQVTSRLTGSVIDPSGSVVPGAVVEVYLPGGANPL